MYGHVHDYSVLYPRPNMVSDLTMVGWVPKLPHIWKCLIFAEEPSATAAIITSHVQSWRVQRATGAADSSSPTQFLPHVAKLVLCR